MPQPRKLTDEAQVEIEWVGLARDQLPTDKELAIKHRVSVNRIYQVMLAARKKLLRELLGSTETKPELVPISPELEALAVEVKRENDYRAGARELERHLGARKNGR